MIKKLTLNDSINVRKNKKVLISDLVGIKGEIFNYIKKGFSFDEEVLEKAGIKKTVRNVKTEMVFVEHEKNNVKKSYPKETESLRNVLKSLHTLNNTTDNYSEGQELSITIDENNLEEIEDE